MSNIQHQTSNICLIDTHAHLDSYSEIDEVIERATKAGVKKLIVVSFDLHCAKFNQDIVSKYENLFSAVGVHPHNAKDLDKNSREELIVLAKNPKVRAIGETGLDFHYLYSEKAQQEEAFRWHIKVANELGLPLIIHSREATEEVFEILGKEGWPKNGLVFHAFSGSFEQAQKIFAEDTLISVTGVVTFKNAPKLQELVEKVDLEKIMLETDSPYLSPEPFRGKTNEPANVTFIAKKIAELKDISVEQVAKTTTKTAKEFFGI